jgi:hypothetical protein
VGTTLDSLVDIDESNVLDLVKGVGLLGRELEQLLQVEDLDVVADTLTSDNKVVAKNLDLAPDNRVVLSRETTKVLEFTLLGNLGERSTVGLADGNLCRSQQEWLGKRILAESSRRKHDGYHNRVF